MAFIIFSNYCKGLTAHTTTQHGRVDILGKKEVLKLGKRLKSKTHFALKEILNLMEYYRTHAEKVDTMENTEFIGVINANFKFDTKILLDRIFEVFDKDVFISREEWVMGMNVFLLGKEKEQIKNCFTVYDLREKGFIAKEEMITLLQNCLNLTGQEEEGQDGIKVNILLWTQQVNLRISF